MSALPGKRLAVVGGGPSGMTAALLLARAGHRVVIFEHEKELGGLWAANLDLATPVSKCSGCADCRRRAAS